MKKLLHREIIQEFEELPKWQHLPKNFDGFHVDYGDIVVRDSEYPNYILAVKKLGNVYLNQSRITPELLKRVIELLEI